MTRIELFALRSAECADRVVAGELPFFSTLDLLYEAAAEAGLVDRYGDRMIELLLAICFRWPA